MNLDEYIADVEAKRDALMFRLLLTANSLLPRAVKNERLKAIATEAKSLRTELEDTIRRHQKRP